MASTRQKIGAFRASMKLETFFATFLGFAILTAHISSATAGTYSTASSSYEDAASSPAGSRSSRSARDASADEGRRYSGGVKSAGSEGRAEASGEAAGLMRREIVSGSSHRGGESSSKQADVQWSSAIKELSDASHALSTAVDKVKQAEEVSANHSRASEALLQSLEELSAERGMERSSRAEPQRAQYAEHAAERTELHDRRETVSLAQAPQAPRSPANFPSGSEDRTAAWHTRTRNEAPREEYREAEHRYDDRRGDAQRGPIGFQHIGGDYFEGRGRDDRSEGQPRRSYGLGSPTSSSNAGVQRMYQDSGSPTSSSNAGLQRMYQDSGSPTSSSNAGEHRMHQDSGLIEEEDGLPQVASQRLNDDHPLWAPPGTFVDGIEVVPSMLQDGNGHAEGPEDAIEIVPSMLQLDSDIEYPVMHLEPSDIADDGRVLILEDELEKAERAQAEIARGIEKTRTLAAFVEANGGQRSVAIDASGVEDSVPQ